MPLVIPDGFAHIAIELKNAADPDPWYWTFGIATTEEPADVLEIAEKIELLWQDTWEGSHSVATTQTAVQVTLAVEDGDPIRADVPNVAHAGTSGGAKLPQNCALLVHKSTNTGGRRHQGRFFLPNVLNEGDVDNVGAIAGATVAEFQTVADAFLTGLASASPGPSIPMVILHSSGISATPGPTVVSRLTVDPVVSTQRRRLR